MKEESTTSKVTELIRRAVLSSRSAQSSGRDGDELYIVISRDTCAKVTACLCSLRPIPRFVCSEGAALGTEGKKDKEAKNTMGGGRDLSAGIDHQLQSSWQP